MSSSCRLAAIELAREPCPRAIIPHRSARPWISGIAPMGTNDAELADRLAQDGYGDAIELRALLPEVYADLKRIAHRQLFRHVPGATLSTTVLVHEAYARLAERGAAPRLTRGHFLALSARVMRQVVVDHARARGADKRGGAVARVELGEDDARIESQNQALLALAGALELLEQADPRLVQLIEQHWFIGLEADELAGLHAVSLRTVQRELKRARAWLTELLSP
jgi:RNA polymerase sigma factor (TIGR02999 family)